MVEAAVQSDGLSIVRSAGEDALMGAFNDAPKCSTATTSLVSISLLGSAGDPVAGQSAQIQVSTPSTIVEATLGWNVDTNGADAATPAGSNIVAGLIQWKT